MIKKIPPVRAGFFCLLFGFGGSIRVPPRPPMSTNGLPKSPVEPLCRKGLRGLEYFRMSTKCLPVLLFDRFRGLFFAVSSGFRNFQTLRQGCDTLVRGGKSKKTSKISVKTENFVTGMLNLSRLPGRCGARFLSEYGPSHGRKNCKEETL